MGLQILRDSDFFHRAHHTVSITASLQGRIDLVHMPGARRRVVHHEVNGGMKWGDCGRSLRPRGGKVTQYIKAVLDLFSVERFVICCEKYGQQNQGRTLLFICVSTEKVCASSL